MANYEQRLEALEKKLKSYLPVLYFFIEAEITSEQQKQVDEAERTGRKVKLINWLEPV